MLKLCECCGHKLNEEFSRIGKIASCDKCGSSFDFYFRKDGELLTVPKHWGKLVAVMTEQSGWEDIDKSRKGYEKSAFDGVFIEDQYYIFVSDDGTIRRAKLGFGWDTQFQQPKGAKKLTSYHCWVVDVCPCST